MHQLQVQTQGLPVNSQQPAAPPEPVYSEVQLRNLRYKQLFFGVVVFITSLVYIASALVSFAGVAAYAQGHRQNPAHMLECRPSKGAEVTYYVRQSISLVLALLSLFFLFWGYPGLVIIKHDPQTDELIPPKQRLGSTYLPLSMFVTKSRSMFVLHVIFQSILCLVTLLALAIGDVMLYSTSNRVPESERMVANKLDDHSCFQLQPTISESAFVFHCCLMFFSLVFVSIVCCAGFCSSPLLA